MIYSCPVLTSEILRHWHPLPKNDTNFLLTRFWTPYRKVRLSIEKATDAGCAIGRMIAMLMLWRQRTSTMCFFLVLFCLCLASSVQLQTEMFSKCVWVVCLVSNFKLVRSLLQDATVLFCIGCICALGQILDIYSFWWNGKKGVV